MKTRFIQLFFAAFMLFALGACNNKGVLEYVNPFIGTGGHGHTYPGASMPFGMVQLSPDTRLEGWDGCSGYHYTDSVIYGFSHTHLSGTGIADYADVLLMPTTGKIKFDNGYQKPRFSGYSSFFDKETEKAEAGWYSVTLQDYNIDVELTATLRAGFHKYTFNNPDSANILLDLEHRDRVIESYIKIVSDTEIEGFRRSKEWAQDQYVYFVAQFSEPIASFILKNDKKESSDVKEISGTKLKAAFSFNLKEKNKNEILVKVGISAVDAQGARNNLNTEIAHWDFEKTKAEAQNTWKESLGRFEVEGGTDDQKTVFYTALYHSFLNPNLYTDADGRFRSTDLKIHEKADFTNYTVFSLWDTYRATHPLFTLVEPERVKDFVRTFLAQYQYGGRLPVWELAGNETDCMIGYHSVSVIADAYAKGITDFDTDLALKAMLHSANLNHLGLDDYKKYGYIPMDGEHESVSKTLEYAYDDWTIAQFAKALGNEPVYNEFIKRAQYYKNIFDRQTGFMRPKLNGNWLTPFVPNEVNFHYTEANAWQYSFCVAQDVQGLMELHGGKEKFAKKLDELFTTDSKTSGREQADITGLIGQYAHGNEPSHHMAYLYNFAGEAWKTQERVREIMDTQYFNAPEGLSGNEDCGQMSSWLVMSAMGFYSVTPGSPNYVIGTPWFKKIRIKLPNGNYFSVEAKNVSATNKYIQKASLHGSDYTKSYLTHADIANGGTLVFEMGSEPNKSWGTGESDIPVSHITDNLLLPVPYFESTGRTFTDSMTVKLFAGDHKSTVFFRLKNKKDSAFVKYEKPIVLTENAEIESYAADSKGNLSYKVASKYIKIPKGRSVKIASKYTPQYNGGGDNGLIDYLRGGTDFRNGSYQGYQGQDFEATVDLGKLCGISYLAAGFLHDIRPWIWLPTEVVFEISTDGENFTEILRKTNEISNSDYKVQAIDLGGKIKPTNARFIRVKAKNFGKIPDWHPGKGGDAYIFVDEIIVE